MPGVDARVFRYGIFQFYAATGELMKDGTPISLETQPAKLWDLPLSRAGAGNASDTGDLGNDMPAS